MAQMDVTSQKKVKNAQAGLGLMAGRYSENHQPYVQGRRFRGLKGSGSGTYREDGLRIPPSRAYGQEFHIPCVIASSRTAHGPS